ncbi:MAG: oxidoreductase [Rhizobacter sp.]|nr:oxidoreductase [Rhizobacter sp.]
MKNSQTWHPAHIRAHRDLSPTVREFEIRPEGGVKPWTVGSHLKLRVLVDGREETRSYSLVGLHDQEVYRIAVKRAEPSRGGSRYMWGLEAGAELLIGEPNNHFELAFNAPQFLLVAGGIGITPLVGMAQLLQAKGADVRMRYAARSDQELVLADVVRQSLGERLQTFCSDAGQRLNLDAEIAALAPRAQMLVCGPIGLLDAARDAWERAQHPPADLRFETFGNSGHHQAQPFWVELPRHQLRIEVPADRSLLDVLNEAGVETLFDCCRGECGLCAMDVLSVQGEIDHRDVFLSPHEQQANQRLCACVSRVSGGGVVLDTAYRAD